MEHSNEFYYITIATKPHPVLDALKKKVENNNEKIIVLGEHENRTIGWESHQNFGVKLREVSEFVIKSFLDPDDIVLMTDAYDVAYFGNKDEIIRRFHNFKKPIVFGSEKNCFPDPQMIHFYNDKEYEFSFLNSGMFIGKVWALRECISDYQYNDRDDDQRYWTKQFITRPDLIELDYDNRLFLNQYDIDMSKFDLNNHQVFYKNRNPLFVHVNGPNKELIYSLI
jgi:hypothetical protein